MFYICSATQVPLELVLGIGQCENVERAEAVQPAPGWSLAGCATLHEVDKKPSF